MPKYIERELTCFDDCFHNPICIFRIKGDEWKKCMHFKNKADVVEVVRCKDCKHCTIYRCSADGGIKQIRCHYDIGTYDEDFYCPLGEKMDGKGEGE